MRIARPYPLMSVVLRYIDKPSLFVLMILALDGVLSEAPDTLPLIEPLRDVAAIALIAALTFLSVRSAAAIGEAIVQAHPLDSADNLQARRIHTQARVLARSVMVVIVIIGSGGALMTFPNVRQIGASLLASAGVAGLVAGIAARPVLGNLIAGLQIALSQPIRLDDVVVIQGEWGRVEEITGTYVSIRIWDQRRLIVPLQWFIENPFTNWTRNSSQIIGTVFFYVDYRMPLAPLREELARILEHAPEWDGRVQVLQVTDAHRTLDAIARARQFVRFRLELGLALPRARRTARLRAAAYPQYSAAYARGSVGGAGNSSTREPLDWVPRSAQAPAGSTAAHTEADPVASRIGRPGAWKLRRKRRNGLSGRRASRRGASRTCSGLSMRAVVAYLGA